MRGPERTDIVLFYNRKRLFRAFRTFAVDKKRRSVPQMKSSRDPESCFMKHTETLLDRKIPTAEIGVLVLNQFCE